MRKTRVALLTTLFLVAAIFLVFPHQGLADDPSTGETVENSGSATTEESKPEESPTNEELELVTNVKLSTTTYTYDGTTKKPIVTAKNSKGTTLVKDTDYTVSYASGRRYVGRYAVKVTFKGNYSGSKTLYFKIRPKGTTLSTVKSVEGGFKATWKKQTTQTTGYQLQYATSSKFSSAKSVTISKNSSSVKTVTKLKKGKKYYVRIRTYKTVNGVKYHSIWSKRKTVVAGTGKLIAIDAGHQGHGNNGVEPLGPGSTTMKRKVSCGTTGRFTGVPEFKLNLVVALKLQKELEKRGYEVLMIRTTHDVDISNAERAKMANKAKADAFIRIHANGSYDKSDNGTLTICQTSTNPYNKKYYSKSKELSTLVVNKICKKTGSKNLGVWETDTMTGINWCQVPVTIVEMGYMTNKKEDKAMQTEEYQDKIVTGIANGIDEFFGY